MKFVRSVPFAPPFTALLLLLLTVIQPEEVLAQVGEASVLGS